MFGAVPGAITLKVGAEPVPHQQVHNNAENMITMVEDPEEDTQAHESIAENYSLSYYAIKCQKIAPPMSTRVIKSDEGNRILMCGYVEYGGRCLENHPSTWSTGFLVEIALLRRKKLPKKPFFMQVVKFHGNAQKNINCVPLKVYSYVPVAEPTEEHSSLPEVLNTEARPTNESIIINIADSDSNNHYEQQVAGPSGLISPSNMVDNKTVSIESLYLEDDRVWFNLSVEI
uniref:Uncharacterized protein n=1 Tax=Ditylenchus dipsaci TaxID=166011 RepID=A0A915DLL2_9BILA